MVSLNFGERCSKTDVLKIIIIKENSVISCQDPDLTIHYVCAPHVSAKKARASRMLLPRHPLDRRQIGGVHGPSRAEAFSGHASLFYHFLGLCIIYLGKPILNYKQNMFWRALDFYFLIQVGPKY